MVAENGYPDRAATSDACAPPTSGLSSESPAHLSQSRRGDLTSSPAQASLSAEDAALLLTLLDAPGSLAHAAASRAITADKFLALIASPAARQAIEEIRAFAAIRRELRADAEREELTAILRDVARATTDLVEKRRAATAALRALRPSSTLGGGARAAAPRGVARAEGASSSSAFPTRSTGQAIPHTAGRPSTADRSQPHRRSAPPRDSLPRSGSVQADRDELDRAGPQPDSPSHRLTVSPSQVLPKPNETLDFAHHILRAVETNAPEAADFTPAIIDAARYYASCFQDAPEPAPAPTPAPQARPP